MNSRIYRKLILVITFCLGAFACASDEFAPQKTAEITEQKIIYVKIPPVRNPKLSAEERYWQMQKFLFPQIEIPKKIPKGLPYDHSVFYIKLEKNGEINLNSEKQASAEALEKRLVEIFNSRQEKGVFEPDSEKVVKAVLLIAPDSAKYSEVFTILEHLENSGADPIVLQIGDLPTTEIMPRN